MVVFVCASNRAIARGAQVCGREQVHVRNGMERSVYRLDEDMIDCTRFETHDHFSASPCLQMKMEAMRSLDAAGLP